MKVYKRLCELEEEKALRGLLDRQILRQRRKCFWKIPAGTTQYELFAFGRIPNGIECDYDPVKLAAVPLDLPDECQNDQSTLQCGKYRIQTASFTAGTSKMESLTIHYDNVLDSSPVNCIGVDPLGAVIHTVYKKKTHVGAQENLKHQIIKMYYKFKMI